MEMYTNKGLVKHAEKALTLNTKYMWGGILRPITPAYIDMLRKMYGVNSGTGYTASRWEELNRIAGKGYYGVDCVGLIKSYYWSGNANGGTGSPKYGAAGFPDVNANFMYQKAKVKGTINTIPEKPGVIVYCKTHPHVGVYVGNGYTIESTLGSRGDGVVKRKLDGLWEYWFECPYIGYSNINAKTKKCRLAYPAVVRKEASRESECIVRFDAGREVEVIIGSKTKDPKTGFIYVEINEGWITESALG